MTGPVIFFRGVGALLLLLIAFVAWAMVPLWRDFTGRQCLLWWGGTPLAIGLLMVLFGK